jgi:hypothetical protein
VAQADGRWELLHDAARPETLFRPLELDVQLDPQHLERLTSAAPLTGIMELIWNALDADAENVSVALVRNPLDGIEEIRVVDDGHGITFGEASDTFGKLGGSWKGRSQGFETKGPSPSWPRGPRPLPRGRHWQLHALENRRARPRR